jgi:enamine deaminase RidA (YjgF/YER057c/UK114 family)
MKRTPVNPVPWLAQHGFSQGMRVDSPQAILEISGQTSVDEEGVPLHEGDMGAQVVRALDNLEATLTEAGFSTGDIARVMIFTTDADELLKHHGLIASRIGASGGGPASTLLVVPRLPEPELMVEIQATAIR